jgi:hypothetical protein
MDDASPAGGAPACCLLLFTKPAIAGRVKTRLIGALSAQQAADLHAAFLADLLANLGGGRFALRLAWAVEPGEALPSGPVPSLRQQGADLGARLFAGLSAAATEFPYVAAIGSDHPELSATVVERAFAALQAGARVVLGPAEDGGYYLVAVRREYLTSRLFADVPWSGPRVLEVTLERCRQAGIEPSLLPVGRDVDTAEDLARLFGELERGELEHCPRTAALLTSWRRVAAAGAPAPQPPLAASR